MADILEQMTKQELIEWIRRNWHFRSKPKLSDVLFMRYDRQTQELIERRERETAELAKIDTAKRDELARQHNESECLQERIGLLKQIGAIDNQVQAVIKKFDKTREKERQVDALYARYERERDKGN